MINLNDLPEDVQTGIRFLPMCPTVRHMYCGEFEHWIDSVLNSQSVTTEQVTARVRQLIEDNESEYFSVLNPVDFLPIPNCPLTPLPSPNAETKPYPIPGISYDTQVSVLRHLAEQSIKAIQSSGVIPIADKDLISRLIAKKAGFNSPTLEGRTIKDLIHWLSTARDLI